MPSRSKTKGNKFENDIVKAFNDLHETEEFRRTPNSGAMMGRSNAAKYAGLSEGVQRTLSSDIITPEWYPFAIECKHYGDKPNYAAIIKENDTKLDHWLAEAVFDAVNQDLHPMLCFKTDRKGAHVAIPQYWISELQIYPTYYLQYANSFTIMGLEQWLRFGPSMIEESGYREQTQLNKLTWKRLEELRMGFTDVHNVAVMLQQLEK
jgi:hypothetical protein